MAVHESGSGRCGGFADLKELLAGPPSPEREEMRAWDARKQPSAWPRQAAKGKGKEIPLLATFNL